MRIELSFSDFLALFGIALTLTIYQFDLKKKIEQIIRNQEGTLTRQQAQAMTRLYLVFVRSHLTEACNRYASHILRQDYANGNFDNIARELHGIYTGVVEDKIRAMFSTFRIRDGRQFNEFAASVSRNSVLNAFEEIGAMFKESLVTSRSLEEVMALLLLKISEASDQGAALYTSSLDGIYRSSDE